MADRLMTDANKQSLLTNWIQSANNRGDSLYFMKSEIDEHSLKNAAFYKGMLIAITNVDDVVAKITFVTLLT